VQALYEGTTASSAAAAFALASLLATLALFTLGIKTFLEWKQERAERLIVGRVDG
jgi:sulfate transport system permease protein